MIAAGVSTGRMDQEPTLYSNISSDKAPTKLFMDTLLINEPRITDQVA